MSARLTSFWILSVCLPPTTPISFLAARFTLTLHFQFLCPGRPHPPSPPSCVHPSHSDRRRQTDSCLSKRVFCGPTTEQILKTMKHGVKSVSSTHSMGFFLDKMKTVEAETVNNTFINAFNTHLLSASPNLGFSSLPNLPDSLFPSLSLSPSLPISLALSVFRSARSTSVRIWLLIGCFLLALYELNCSGRM